MGKKTKFRKNFPMYLGKLLTQNYRPAKLSFSFSPQWPKNSGEKAKGSRMPLVRAEYHSLLRRVAAHSNQGLNDGRSGKGHNSPGAEKGGAGKP